MTAGSACSQVASKRKRRRGPFGRVEAGRTDGRLVVVYINGRRIPLLGQYDRDGGLDAVNWPVAPSRDEEPVELAVALPR